MPLTSSMEDYLEAVLVLQQQKGYVRCVDVAELLDVKKPSVSRAVKELSKKKCLIKKDDGTLSLTEQGQQIAQQIYEKHQFFTKRLVEAGVPQDIAAQDGCKCRKGCGRRLRGCRDSGDPFRRTLSGYGIQGCTAPGSDCKTDRRTV